MNIYECYLKDVKETGDKRTFKEYAMDNYTEEQFIKDSTNPDLTRAVLEQIGVDWEDLKDYPEDYRDAGNGVSGFIYYNETVPFAQSHLITIMNAVNQFENETGCVLDKHTYDKTQFYNWLAWFALESVVQDLIDIKERD